MPDPAELADAEQLGRRAAQDGEAIAKCPWNSAQGSPTRALAFAFKKGYRKYETDHASALARLETLERDLKSIDTLNPDHTPCVRCGKVAVGSAHSDAGRLCHGLSSRPSCYELTTRGQ